MIAADVARQENDRLEVVAVIPGTGDGHYAEILLVVRGCRADPCRVSLGIMRDNSEVAIRANIADKIREHLFEHPQS